jgi:hypothetical protein
MAPRSQQVVIDKLEFEQEQDPQPLVCVEPVHNPIEGVLPACALTRVECSRRNTSLMTSQADHMAAKPLNARAYVILANFSDQTLTLPKSTVLVLEEEVSESQIGRINQRKNQIPIRHINFRGRRK